MMFILMNSSHDLFSQLSPAYKDITFTEYFRRTSGWTASDATISVPLPSGKVIWLFGDTHIDGYKAADTSVQCLFQVRNSMMVQDILNPSEFITILDNTKTGMNRTPVKADLDNSTYFWPGHGYAKGDTAIIFWQQYSGADYTLEGNYVSRIYTPGFVDASSIKELTRLPLPVDVEYGTSVVVDSADNYLYIYGHKKDWIVNRPLVARCSMDQDILGSWEFFDGTGWSPDVNSSQQVMGDTKDYVSPTYSVIKLQDKYYMISQDIGFLSCGLGREIYSWESDSPQGPFINKKIVYTIEDKYKSSYYITYNATAHPEFIKNNELLISYNVNGICPSECENDPFTSRRNADGYRPKFIRVPLTYIDPDLNVPDPVFPIDSPITGIEADESTFPQLTIYPNPSTDGRIAIAMERINRTSPASPVRIRVTNVYGQRILDRYLQQTENTIQIDDNGLYIVQISIGARHYVTKVLIQ